MRSTDSLYVVLDRGMFHAELTEVMLGRMAVRRGREALPRLAESATPDGSVLMMCWPGRHPLPVIRGMPMLRGGIYCRGPGFDSYDRSFADNEFVSLSIDRSALSTAAASLVGAELKVASASVVHPPDHLRTWLFSAIECVLRLAEQTPDVVSSPHANRALEDALLEPAIMCLLHGQAVPESESRTRQATLVRSFQGLMEENFDRPMRLIDFCHLLRVPGRSLRRACEEQTGVSPHQMLAARRLQLARYELLRSDPASTTVTEIATRYGIWELGRFAVAYKARFGESPSATLRKGLDDTGMSRH